MTTYQKSSKSWSGHFSTAPLPSPKNLENDPNVLRELEQLARKLSLGEPIYKIAGGTSSGRGFFCSVHVRGHQTGSLVDYPTAEQARCAAAKNSVNLLKTYYADKLIALDHGGLPSKKSKTDEESQSKDSTVEPDANGERASNQGDDFERVAENLLYLLANMPRGVYSHAVPAKYQETYKQNLPPDWLTRIKEGYPEFVVDEVDAFRSIVAKRRVKPPPASASTATTEKLAASPVALPSAIPPLSAAAGDKGPTAEPLPQLQRPVDDLFLKDAKKVQTPTKVRFSDQVNEIVFKREDGEEEYEIIQPPPVDSPPPFALPETTDICVFVSVVKTPADFTVRFLGEEHSEQYEQLQRNMQDFYEVKKLGQKLRGSSFDAFLGGTYAARAEECWHRVYLHEIIPADEGIGDEGVTASVYFIDHGDSETIPLDDLRILEQNFMRLPVQAAPVCLAGFENYSLEQFTPEMLACFRELTVAKIFPAKYVGSNAQGDAESPSGPFLLLLVMPSENGNGSNEQAGQQNGAENAVPQGSSLRADSPLLVNDIILQLAPKGFVGETSAGNVQRG